MDISEQTHNVKASIGALEVRSTESQAQASSQFASILETALDREDKGARLRTVQPNNLKAERVQKIPDWVHHSYAFDKSQPRKPNMREFIEAMSGQNLENLYADRSHNWHETCKLASDLLYGVVGSSSDTRDWNEIMNSKNIVSAAQNATNIMYGAQVKTVAINASSKDVEQIVDTIVDRNGKILRTLRGNLAFMKETLTNFGIGSDSLEANFNSISNSSLFNQSALKTISNHRSSDDT